MVETPHGSTIGAGKLTYEDLVNTPDDGKRYEILALFPELAIRLEKVWA